MPLLDAYFHLTPLQLVLSSVITIGLCVSASFATLSVLSKRDAANMHALRPRLRRRRTNYDCDSGFVASAESQDSFETRDTTSPRERDWEFSLPWLSSEFRNVHNFLNSESLAELSLSESVFLRPSAMNILLRRAAKPVNLRYITECARQSSEHDLRIQSVTVLQCLAQYEDIRDSLLELDIPAVLCTVLLEESNETALKQALMTLFELIAHKDSEQVLAVEKHGLCQGLHRILLTASSRDLVNWSILLMHNLAVSELTQRQIIALDSFEFFGKALRLAYGNWTLQKVCFHALVRLLEALTQVEAQAELVKLDAFNIIGLISSSIKIDDTELVHWAVGLMHEFCVKDVLRDRFRAEKQLIKSLNTLISSQDIGLAKLILRIFKFLSMKSKEFQLQLISIQALPKIVSCLSAANEDAQYWALTLLHDLAAHSEAAPAILSSPYFGTLIELSTSSRNMIPIYVLDIVYLLSSSHNSSFTEILTSGVCSVAIRYINNPESEYITNGLSCILNFCLKGVQIVDEFTNLQAIYHVSNVLLSASTGVNDLLCAKILCGIGYARNEKIEEISVSALQNYVLGILIEYSHCAFEALSSVAVESSVNVELNQIYWVRRICRLDPTFVASVTAANELLNSTSVRDSQAAIILRLISKLFSRLENCLQGILMFITFPHLMQQFFELHVDIIEIMADALIDVTILTLSESDRLSEVCQTVKWGEEINIMRLRIASGAMHVLCALYCHEKMALYLRKEEFFVSLCAFLGGNDNLLRAIAQSIAKCSVNCSRYELLAGTQLLESLRNLLMTSNDYSIKFSAHKVLCQIFNPLNESAENCNYARLDISTATPNLLLSPDCREIWNFSYAFESIRARNGVSGSGKYVYEAEICTEGLIQVGWATGDCIFEYLFGRGIGDNEDSYSCDGFRQRKWHGNRVHHEGESFGEKWNVGDTISTVIDLDAGEILYYLNGIELGSAFSDINTAKIWYPAVSLSTEQGCIVRFGGLSDRLFYQVGDESVIPICFAFDEEVLVCAQDFSVSDSDSKPTDTRVTTSQVNSLNPPSPSVYGTPDDSPSVSNITTNDIQKSKFEICALDAFKIAQDFPNYMEFTIFWDRSADLQVGWQAIADADDSLYFSPREGAIFHQAKIMDAKKNSTTNDVSVTAICSIQPTMSSCFHVTVGLGSKSIIQNGQETYFYVISWQGVVVAVVSCGEMGSLLKTPTVRNGRVLTVNVGQKLFELPIISPAGATSTAFPEA